MPTRTITAGGVEFAYRELETNNPGTPVVFLIHLAVRRSCVVVTTPFDWKLQDVGSPQFQLEVSGLDALIDRTKQAGYRFLSVGAKPHSERVRAVRVRH